MKTEDLWFAFSDKLKAYLKSKIQDEKDVEDMLQDIFFKVHAHQNELTEKENIGGWLFRITRNTLSDFYRKKARETQIELPVWTEDEQIQINDCLLTMINNLPEKYAKPLISSDVNGIKQQLIADEMGISISGAKSRVQRARELLKKELIDCCNYAVNEQGHLEGTCGEECSCEKCK